jgi:hypothetical protein
VQGREHKHRDLWVGLAVALIIGGPGISIAIWAVEHSAAHVGFWPHAGEIAGLALTVLGVFLSVAVVRGWWLPGGFRQVESPAPPLALEQRAAPAVHPAEWKATCDESGEFPDTKALMFGIWHRFDNRGALMAFGDLRCMVTDPDGITTSATGTANYYQYIEYFFKGVPPVRPGLYRFSWEGRKSNGEWAVIASGEHEVQSPPKTGLEVVIEDEKRTPFPGVANILEIEYCIANHDPVPHELRPAIRGVNPAPLGSADDPEFMAVLRKEHAIRQRRQLDTPPPVRVQPTETVHGVYVTTFPWDPTGKFPDYTLVIRDERNVYTARPHGAGEDPLVR